MIDMSEQTEANDTVMSGLPPQEKERLELQRDAEYAAYRSSPGKGRHRRPRALRRWVAAYRGGGF